MLAHRCLAGWVPRAPSTTAAAVLAASVPLTRSAAAPPWPPLSHLDPHQRMGCPPYLASRLPSTTCSVPDTLQPGGVVPHPLRHTAWIGWGIFLYLLGEAELSTQDTTPMQGSPGGPVTQPGLLTTQLQPESSGLRAWDVSTRPLARQREGTSTPTFLPLSIHHSLPVSLRMLLWTLEGFRRSQRLGRL